MLHKAKPNGVGGETSNGGSPVPGSLLASFPTVREFLFSSKWADGSSRTTGTILWCADLGVLKAVVRDRDQSRVAFMSGESIEAILAALDAGLVTDQMDWRPDKPWGKKAK